MYQIDLTGKVALIAGVADKHSLGWHIAGALANAGADLVFAVQNPRLQKDVEALINRTSLISPDRCLIICCDVRWEREIDNLFLRSEERFGKLDFLIHSIAFAPPKALQGRFLNTTKSGFLLAMEVSVFSLVSLSRRFAKIASPGASIVTLTHGRLYASIPSLQRNGAGKSCSGGYC